jgi:hypothetical protein
MCTMTSCSLRRLQEPAEVAALFGSVAPTQATKASERANSLSECQSKAETLTTRPRDDTVQRFAEDLEVR